MKAALRCLVVTRLLSMQRRYACVLSKYDSVAGHTMGRKGVQRVCYIYALVHNLGESLSF